VIIVYTRGTNTVTPDIDQDDFLDFISNVIDQRWFPILKIYRYSASIQSKA
jgi:hypothetical protein